MHWSWDENNIKIFDPQKNNWRIESYLVISAAEGYNANITEQMYIDELVNFFEAVEGKKEFFNSMEYDHKILKLLYAIEISSEQKKSIEVI